MGLPALLFATFCLIYVPFVESNVFKMACLGVWTLGIPLYFFVEWVYWVPPHAPDADTEMKRYRESRDLARAFWLAVAALLTLMYFGNHLKGTEVGQLRKDVEALRGEVNRWQQQSEPVTRPSPSPAAP